MLTPLGVILAGGLSTRMGRDKATLEIAGKRLIDRAAELVQSVCPKAVVSCRAGNTITGYQCIEDLRPELGPLGGIFSVLNHRSAFSADALLVVPVDMPLLTPSLLGELVRGWPRSSHDDPTIDGVAFTGMSLPALFAITPKLRSELESLCAEHTPSHLRSVWALMERLSIVRVQPGTSNGFLNLNSPKDLLSEPTLVT